MDIALQKVEILEKLFLAYLGLIIVFNVVTIFTVNFFALQLGVSLIVIAFILWMIFNTHTRMKLVWWSMMLFSILGILRPVLEYIFSRQVPYFAANFFPPFTPFFSIIGFIIMLIAFGILTDLEIKKKFNTSEREQ
ncbi:MAG: hypothetical protein ACJAV6_000183 [Candidatus Paceibacteria bacterium]|jgi:hypothetical protein